MSRRDEIELDVYIECIPSGHEEVGIQPGESEESVEEKIEAYYQDCVDEVTRYWDFDALIADCEDNYQSAIKEYGQKEVDEWSEYGVGPRSVFLGTVFTLCPSGKFYTPFANSNVGYEEYVLDACWYDAMDTVFESHGMYVVSGDGDPCDLFAVVFRD